MFVKLRRDGLGAELPLSDSLTLGALFFNMPSQLRSHVRIISKKKSGKLNIQMGYQLSILYTQTRYMLLGNISNIEVIAICIIRLDEKKVQIIM